MTMAALARLEDIASEAAQKEFRDRDGIWFKTGSSATSGGIVHGAATTLGALYVQEPCPTCAHIGSGHTGIPSHGGHFSESWLTNRDLAS